MNLLPKRFLLRSKIESLCNNFVGYAVIIGILALSIVYYYLIVLAVFAIFYYWKRINKKVLIFMIGTFLLCLALRLIIYLVPITITEVRVISVCETKYGYDYVLLARGLRYKTTYSNYYPPGSILKINYQIFQNNFKVTPGGYNEIHNNILHIVRARIKLTSVTVLKQRHNSLVLKYINLFPEQTKLFFKGLLGYAKYDSSFSFSFFKEVGLLRFFFFSGIHIVFIEKIIRKLFYYLSVNPLVQKVMILCFELSIMFFVGINLVILKFIIGNAILFVLDVLCIKTSRLNRLSISFVLVTILFPNFIFGSSYIVCFLFSYIAILLEHMLPKKRYWLKNCLSAVLFYFVMLPILLLYQNRFNLLIILLAPALIIGFNYFLMPLILAAFIFYPASYLLEMVIKLSNLLTSVIDASIFSVSIPRMHPLVILVFYILLYLLLTSRKRKRIIISFAVLAVLLNFNLFKFYLNPFSKIYFFSVGQGNSSLVIDGISKKTVVVDMYGKCLEAYDSLGIRKLNVVILTHSDLDHIADFNRVAKYLKIEKLYLNNYDTYETINQRQKTSYKLETTYKAGNIEYTFFGPIKNYGTKNNNSLITKLNLFGLSVLYTGDIDQRVENDLVKKYHRKINADTLMISHHGSGYGSSEIFLDTVGARNAIISCGAHNNYYHPSSDVIKNLEHRNINNYVTFQSGTLMHLGLFRFQKEIIRYKIFNLIVG